jgi:hypothetical protein
VLSLKDKQFQSGKVLSTADQSHQNGARLESAGVFELMIALNE